MQHVTGPQTVRRFTQYRGRGKNNGPSIVLNNLHPVFHMYLLQCCGKDVCSTTSISNLSHTQLIAYVFGKVVIEATLLIAGKHEGMPYTWIDYGPEHAIWEPEACLKPMHWMFADLLLWSRHVVMHGSWQQCLISSTDVAIMLTYIFKNIANLNKMSLFKSHMVCLILLVTMCSTKLHRNRECCRLVHLVLIDRDLLTHTEQGSCIQSQFKNCYTVVLLRFPLALHNRSTQTVRAKVYHNARHQTSS